MGLLLFPAGLMLMALCLSRIYAGIQKKSAWVKVPGRIMSLGLRQSGTKRNGRPRMGELYCISYRDKNGRDLLGVWLALLLMSAYMVLMGGDLLLRSGP
jgi:hypothetical protein